MPGSVLADSVMVSIVGGLLAIDRTAALQIMISRPIVAAPVAGYLLGHPSLGIMCGILLELLFIGELPVGGYVPVHETGLAVLTTALACALVENAEFPAIGAGTGMVMPAEAAAVAAALLVSLPVSALYQKADAAVRKYNAVFHGSALRSIDTGRPGLASNNLKGLSVFFAVHAIIFFATVYPLSYLASLLHGVAFKPAKAFSIAFGVCLFVGFASALGSARTGRGFGYFLASGVAAAVLWMALA